MNVRVFVSMVGLCIVSSAVAQATSIDIPDYSFEGITTSIVGPSGISTSTNTGPIGAWSAFAAGSLALSDSIDSGTASSLGAPGGADGSYVARITLPAGAGASAGLNQILTDTFLPNSIYTLSFELDGGTTISLLAGSSLSLESDSTPVATLSGANLVSLLDGNGDFQSISLTYQTGNTPPSGHIGIEFDAASVAGVGGSIYFDNFKLDVAPVPEPQTMTLATAGLILMLVFFKRHVFKRRILNRASVK